MEFPQSVKRKARAASAYRCCLCHEGPIVHVHHISPDLKEDEGLHDFDNAAPLCVRCHDVYGSDPARRKYMKEAREWWYDFVEKKYGQPETLEKITEDLGDLKSGVSKLNELMITLNEQFLQGNLNEVSEITSSISTVSGHVSGTASTAVLLDTNVRTNFFCMSCGTRIGVLESTEPIDECPNCGSKVL